MSNVRIRTEEPKIRVGLYLDEALYKGLQVEAKKQERSVSNLINVIVKTYLK